MAQIKERLLNYLKINGISKQNFCKETGISYANMVGNSIKSEFGGEQISTILMKFPNINSDWLITGQGSMSRASDGNETKEGKVAALPAASAAGIPLIPEAAFAGVFRGEIAISPSEYEYYIVPSFRNADFLIRVCGDSMIPRYHSGDIVACKRLALNDLFFQWGKVYILDTNQGALIKKVEQAENPENIRLVSENEAYKPFEIARNSIYHIAIVLGLIRLE